MDSKLCTAIVQAFVDQKSSHGKAGAAVVMNYRTGELLALVSVPVFDPMNITDEVKTSTLHPFWNRALQGTLPPGSTFKIIPRWKTGPTRSSGSSTAPARRR